MEPDLAKAGPDLAIAELDYALTGQDLANTGQDLSCESQVLSCMSQVLSHDIQVMSHESQVWCIQKSFLLVWGCPIRLKDRTKKNLYSRNTIIFNILLFLRTSAKKLPFFGAFWELFKATK